MKFSILIVILVLLVSSCSKDEEEQTPPTDDLKKKELELKEKELQLKEREILDKKEADLKAKEDELKNSQNIDKDDIKDTKINLRGTYSGSIKDGTLWYMYITNFTGKNLKGYNKIHWESTPEGFKTNFSGTYDPSTREIILYEDRNATGSGKFIGTVSVDGKSISGDWFRYSDGNSFTWNLSKTED